MKLFLLILVALLLTACGGMPTAAPAPSPIPLTATQLPPSETPTPASTETHPAPTPTAAAESYTSQLDITFESPVQQLKYNGAETEGQTSVDKSAASHGIHEVTMTPELQAKLSMRALHNIFLPEEEDNDANLAAFAKKLADVQAGNGSCADFAKTISMYDANGSGAPTEMTVVPACGASPVPDGAKEIKSINFVTGAWYVWSEELQKHIAKVDTPWFKVIIPGGSGAGVLFDQKTGEMNVFAGLDYMAEGGSKGSGYVASQLELLLAYLRYFSEGKNLNLKSQQIYYDRSLDWVRDLEVK